MKIIGLSMQKIAGKKQTKKYLLEVISGFRKVIGYKINLEQSIVFPYAINEHMDTEIKNTIQFTID